MNRFRKVSRFALIQTGLVFASAAIGVLSVVSVARAEDDLPPIDESVEQREPWSDSSARTMPRGRVEVGLFSPARWAPWEGVELGLNPVWFFMLPHVEAKLTWLAWNDAWYFGSQHRVSYPSPFLNFVSREGAGGLLPPDTDVPTAVMLDNDLLLSRTLGPDHMATLRFGISVAPRTSSDNFPLLDFPFLYPRFAPLYAPFVPRAGATIEGRVYGPVHFALDVQASYLPIDEDQGITDAWAYEEGLTLHYRPSEKHQLSTGMLVEQADYPIGWRMHFLPTVDYRYAW